MTRINLHTHSIYSDGSDTPERVVELAANANVELLSLTDHNTMDGYGRFEAACNQKNIKFIKGVELDCREESIGFNKEVLAYFPNGGEECLAEVFTYKQQLRYQRVISGLERLSKALDLPNISIKEVEKMAIEEKGFIGFISNKLIYRYLLTKSDSLPDYETLQDLPLWKDVWNRNEPNQKYSLYELISLISSHGGFPVIPHFAIHFDYSPKKMLLKEDEYLEHLKEMKSLGLWALELHPYKYKAEQEELNTIIARWAETTGLRLTTGSDYHGGITSAHRIFEWFRFEFDNFEMSRE